MFGVTILGNNSALPAYDRHPTSQVVTLDQYQFLIDCGEGTQMQLSRYKVRRSRINHIFISHMHGDHYFGLPGLITSMGLLGRDTDLHLFAPAQMQGILQAILAAAETTLPFNLHFHALEGEEMLVDEARYSIESFQVNHRIPCWGFIFREKKPSRKINKESIGKYKFDSAAFERLKVGEDVNTEEGVLVKNEEVTFANTPALSYAFTGDTAYNPAIADKVKNVTLLYHETTYLKELEERAHLRFHCTTTQAANIALKANVSRLIIGHFSSKYENLEQFANEAREVFPNTELALEGVSYRVDINAN